jgi:peptidase M50-like protein
MGNGVPSGKWWPVLRSASFSLGALAVVVSLHKLSAAYDLWVDWLWADWAVWFCVGVALGFVWHEARHLLCATLGALPVRLMSVGVGPLLWRSHVGDVRFDLRLLPIGSMVASYPLVDVGRWEEGKAILSLVAAIEGSFDLLMTQIYLARAEYALGNPAAARALAEAARRTGEAHPHWPVVTMLLPRLEAELARVRPGGSDTSSSAV